MATFSAKPTEGQDPWGATDLAWRASVESAVNTVEGTAGAALPSASFDTRLGTRVKVDNTVGRTASVWDSTNSRWQLIYGDTGRRDISSILINGWTGSVFIRRQGYTVTLEVEGLNGAAATADAFLANVPGFASTGTVRGILHTAANSPTIKRVSEASGNLAVAGGATSAHYGVIIWSTAAAWPTVLPGTASGAVPNA